MSHTIKTMYVKSQYPLINKDKTEYCSCCGSVVVYNNGEPPHNIHIQATNDAIIERVSSKRMSVIKGDCPLSEMVELLVSDTKYTIVQFLRCHECGNVIFWGLCIRGAPIYEVSDEESIQRWRWE